MEYRLKNFMTTVLRWESLTIASMLGITMCMLFI